MMLGYWECEVMSLRAVMVVARAMVVDRIGLEEALGQVRVGPEGQRRRWQQDKTERCEGAKCHRDPETKPCAEPSQHEGFLPSLLALP